MPIDINAGRTPHEREDKDENEAFQKPEFNRRQADSSMEGRASARPDSGAAIP